MALRFLVVDDASFIRDMVKKQLRDRIPGAEVYDANDGNRAIAQLKKQRIDVILSDWEMPGMSGEELLRWVRSDDTYKTTPFIMVTSRGDKSFVVKAIQAGVSDFITKPFTSDELTKKTVKQLAKIGKSPKDAIKTAGSGDRVAFASVDVLTGGGGAEKKPEAAAAKPAAKKAAKAKAQLRFATVTCPCVLTDMSLQAVNGLMQRQDNLPALFEQAAVDIEIGQEVARLNGYLHSIAAGDNKVDTSIIKFTVRFVDNDPEKFEALSRFIAKNR
ncbi:response regulator [Pseudomaricurvus sp.]|uniref:response regulator n=1 Tax=Pseudomaricurvus sp. TaxID=2004510 RepID=UPI003F6C59FA